MSFESYIYNMSVITIFQEIKSFAVFDLCGFILSFVHRLSSMNEKVLTLISILFKKHQFGTSCTASTLIFW